VQTYSKRALMKLMMAATGTAALGAMTGSARAQAWPNRPITIIVPFPPGGGVDAMARLVAEKLTAALGQNVIVENKGGGGGTIGTRLAARAEPDGYTLLLGHSATTAINPHLYKNAGYETLKDFTPVGLVASMPVALLAHPSFPAKTVKEAIEIAKKDDGNLNFGTSGVGTGGYMCAELFKSMAGIKMTIIPYKGTGPLMNDLLGGHVKVAFGVLPPALGNLKSGNLRAIAVTGKKRFSGLPDVPTADESGLPGFDAVLQYGLLAPAGTPQPIIDRLNKELTAAVNTDAVKARIRLEGGDAETSTPAEHRANIEQDNAKWAKLIKQLGLKVD
jgi:tripartite-type tricarboxylate transporter receptor subunit TctC